MVQNYILSLLLNRQAILLPGIGVLNLERQWAQFSSDQSSVMPPFDELIIAPEDENYDVDVVQFIATQIEAQYDEGYRIWCDYLATEAVDGVLTIETVAMIEIDRLNVIALDPNFALQLAPETELIEVDFPHFEQRNTQHHQYESQDFEHLDYDLHDAPTNQYSKTPQHQYTQTNLPQNRYPQQTRSQMGFLSYSSIMLGLLSGVYLIYFFFFR